MTENTNPSAITATVDALNAVADSKQDEGKLALWLAASSLYDAVTTMDSAGLEVVDAVRSIREKHLYVYLTGDDGKPVFGNWKGLVKSLFKGIAPQVTKGTRNNLIALLAGENLTLDDLADTFDLSKTQVKRIVDDAEKGTGDDDGDGTTATRKAQEAKRDAVKLEDAMRACIAAMSDRGAWTDSELVTIDAVADDLRDAIQRQLDRRGYVATPPVQGTNGRTGTVHHAPQASVAEMAEKAGVPLTGAPTDPTGISAPQKPRTARNPK